VLSNYRARLRPALRLNALLKHVHNVDDLELIREYLAPFEGIVSARSLADLLRMAKILSISPEKHKAAKPKYVYSAWTLWPNLVAMGSR
jgi:hypothetical protein